MIQGPKKTVSILMPLDLYRQLKARSDDAGRSLSSYVRRTLKEHLLHLEDRPETPAAPRKSSEKKSPKP